MTGAMGHEGKGEFHIIAPGFSLGLKEAQSKGAAQKRMIRQPNLSYATSINYLRILNTLSGMYIFKPFLV